MLGRAPRSERHPTVIGLSRGGASWYYVIGWYRHSMWVLRKFAVGTREELVRRVVRRSDAVAQIGSR